MPRGSPARGVWGGRERGGRGREGGPGPLGRRAVSREEGKGEGVVGGAAQWHPGRSAPPELEVTNLVQGGPFPCSLPLHGHPAAFITPNIQAYCLRWPPVQAASYSSHALPSHPSPGFHGIPAALKMTLTAYTVGSSPLPWKASAP